MVDTRLISSSFALGKNGAVVATAQVSVKPFVSNIWLQGDMEVGANSEVLRSMNRIELALVLDATGLVKRLNLLLCAGQMSAANQSLIVTALNATALTASSTDNAKRDRVAAAVLLVMASSEYLIQK